MADRFAYRTFVKARGIMENQPLKILELFGGIGAFSAALERLEIPYEIADYVEIDKYAVKSYNAIHGTNFEPQDICQWDKDPDVDFIMHGSPCFTADTLVLTQEGYKKIVDIQEGDCVLDKNNQYQNVEKWIPQGKKEIWNLSCMGTDGIQTTENHRFWARKKEKQWNNQLRKYQTIYHDSEWVECKNLTKDYLIGYAINQENEIPVWDGSIYTRGNEQYKVKKLDLTDPVLWYLAGRYVADGWIRRRKERNNHISGFTICCGKHKKEHFVDVIQEQYPFSLIEEKTVYKFQFSNKEFGEFLSQFGEGAENKRIPGFVFSLPVSLLESFLEGYWDADGCVVDHIYKATTISRKLAYGLGQCIAKVHQTPFRIYKNIGPSKTIIDEREVNQKDTYQVVFKKDKEKQDHAFYENGIIWFPVRGVENTHESQEVYDITVSNSHSFTANGMIAHNCQDFSIAGLQAGGDKDSGTRSSLMYETVRIVQKLKPKYVLWENVANMMSDKHRHNFDSYWEAMESFGYHNASWKLNAKDYGVPQNRVRIFTLSVREDLWHQEYFLPPKGQKLDRCLVDILERHVEEKYYLSDKLVQSLLKHKEKHKALGHGFGCEIKDVYQDIANPIICGGQGLEKNLIPNEVSPTISARYFKDGSDCLLRVHQIGNLFQYKRENPSAGRVYDKNGLSPTLTNMQGGHRQPYIVEADAVYSNPMIAAMRGRYVEPKMTSGKPIAGCIRSTIYKQGTRNLIENILHQKGYEGVIEPSLRFVGGIGEKDWAKDGKKHSRNFPQGQRVYDSVGLACSQTAQGGGLGSYTGLYYTQYRIRKLTPKECWRLMGFTDEEFEKAQAVNSNTQLYKQAGNSIVVDVLVAILKEVFAYA